MCAWHRDARKWNGAAGGYTHHTHRERDTQTHHDWLSVSTHTPQQSTRIAETYRARLASRTLSEGAHTGTPPFLSCQPPAHKMSYVHIFIEYLCVCVCVYVCVYTHIHIHIHIHIHPPTHQPNHPPTHHHLIRGSTSALVIRSNLSCTLEDLASESL